MLSSILDLVLLTAALVLAVPCTVFVLECLLAVLPGGGEPPVPVVDRPLRKAVLIPAHNEQSGLGATLQTVMPQLGADDWCLVVADNCTDGTAALARSMGARVALRTNPDERGKGYALAFGLDALAADPPDVVIVVDADIEVRAGSVDALARLTYAHGRPVQADNVVSPEDPTPISVISALAFLVRNRVRARGLARAGLPCHLTGTGMAFTWDVVRKAPPTGAYLAEDLLMGLELALLGHPPMYTNHAGVHSLLPDKGDVARKERTRWEHGQLTTVRGQAPRMIMAGVTRMDVGLLALGLDLCVPPLALLVSLLCAAWAVCGIFALLDFSALPLAIVTASLGGVGTAVLLAWLRFGRATLPAKYIVAIPLYVFWKLPVYITYLVRGREKNWEPTERTAKDAEPEE